uniref:Solute carrier organic anion transporter family member 5A1 n=2 Tax=Timema TaxID=61471 RepID=A0A7R9HQ02_9NEOP|nr:unnamed protein product [Timema cristinae]CAD7430263.1 unnamed protein product [Timema monikensis]
MLIAACCPLDMDQHIFSVPLVASINSQHMECVTDSIGNVPCPIVYGAVVDSACLVWETTCGERGACWLYDANVFRMFFHGTTGAILLCAFFVDIIVWYKAGSINFVDEQVPIQEEELDPIASKTRSETSV